MSILTSPTDANKATHIHWIKDGSAGGVNLTPDDLLFRDHQFAHREFRQWRPPNAGEAGMWAQRRHGICGAALRSENPASGRPDVSGRISRNQSGSRRL